MKCQILFFGKNKKNINLSSAENAQRVVKVNCPVNTIKVMSSQSVYLTTLFLGMLSQL